jgi:hypothetical protein
LNCRFFYSLGAEEVKKNAEQQDAGNLPAVAAADLTKNAPNVPEMHIEGAKKSSWKKKGGKGGKFGKKSIQKKPSGVQDSSGKTKKKAKPVMA